MIEYAKVILKNVSPWKTLFHKELVKCLEWTESEEIDELHIWCIDNFYDKHPQIIKDLCMQKNGQLTNSQIPRISKQN